MIWGEGLIRDKVNPSLRGSSMLGDITYGEGQLLVEEIDKLRDYMRRIRIIADDKVHQQLPGWGAWSTVQRLVKEGLGE
jgi:hypothetical protein